MSDSLKTTLDRVCAVLDVPTSAFHGGLDSVGLNTTVNEQAQAVARLFALIPTQEQRDQVLALIRLLMP